jgi:hypothetical protein
LTPSGGTWVQSVLHRFGGSGDGAQPSRDLVLVLDQAGNIYGTTSGGGVYGYGTVFELSYSGSGWNETILYNFQGASDGAGPSGGVLFDQAGNLYGIDDSVVYILSPSGGRWNFQVLTTIQAGSGAGLTMDAAGNLYGASVGGGYGCGVIFEVVKGQDTWSYTALHNFAGSDGKEPYTTVAIGANGKLYGTAAYGGAYGYGVVWEISP